MCIYILYNTSNIYSLYYADCVTLPQHQGVKKYCGISCLDMFKAGVPSKNTMWKHQTMEEHRHLKQS